MAEYICSTDDKCGCCDAYEQAERIVRCRDCKHFEPALFYGFECYHIHPSGATVEPNGFCAWGERDE